MRGFAKRSWFRGFTTAHRQEKPLAEVLALLQLLDAVCQSVDVLGQVDDIGFAEARLLIAVHRLEEITKSIAEGSKNQHARDR